MGHVSAHFEELKQVSENFTPDFNTDLVKTYNTLILWLENFQGTQFAH